MKQHRILLILPAYNEEGKIGRLVKKSKDSIVKDVFVACDGCIDKTAEEAAAAGAIVSSLPQRAGVGHAIRRGVDYALDNDYDVCVVMGGDDQDDPKEIPRLIEKLDSGYDFVIGSRYIPGGRTVNQNLFRFLSTKTYSLFFSIMTLHWISDASNGFRAFLPQVAKRCDLWRKELDGYELEPYLLFDMVKYFRYAEVPVTKYYHLNQSYSKMKPFVDWFNIIKPVMMKTLEDLGGKRPKR